MLTATTSHSARARVHERDVPGVERPHGGHQADGPAGGPGRIEPGRGTGCRRLDDVHPAGYTAAGTAGRHSAWASWVARAAPAW